MEDHERNLIETVLESNFRLRKLYEEHRILERQLDEYNSRGFLTADEEMEVKHLKKRKLLGVDKMMSIIHEQQEEQEFTFSAGAP